MQIKEWSDIVDFHVKFEIFKPLNAIPLDEETLHFRTRFLEEELDELEKSYNEKNMVDFIDALVDLAYVAIGTAYMHGDNFEITHAICNKGAMPIPSGKLKQEFPPEDAMSTILQILRSFIRQYNESNKDKTNLYISLLMLHAIFDNSRLFALGCGFNWDEHWEEVHSKNMLKERAKSSDDSRSKRKNSLDVVKPEGWTGPDHRKIIEKTALSNPSIFTA